MQSETHRWPTRASRCARLPLAASASAKSRPQWKSSSTSTGQSEWRNCTFRCEDAMHSFPDDPRARDGHEAGLEEATRCSRPCRGRRCGLRRRACRIHGRRRRSAWRRPGRAQNGPHLTSTPREPETMPAASFSSVMAAAASMECSATLRFSAECPAILETGGGEAAKVICVPRVQVGARRCTTRRSRTCMAARHNRCIRLVASAASISSGGGKLPTDAGR